VFLKQKKVFSPGRNNYFNVFVVETNCFSYRHHFLVHIFLHAMISNQYISAAVSQQSRAGIRTQESTKSKAKIKGSTDFFDFFLLAAAACTQL